MNEIEQAEKTLRELEADQALDRIKLDTIQGIMTSRERLIGMAQANLSMIIALEETI